MIHYKDMTFCSAECVNRECPRNYSPDVHKAAVAWGGENAPVAFSDFSADCKDFEPHKEMFRG